MFVDETNGQMRFLTKTGTSTLYNFNEIKASVDYQLWCDDQIHQKISAAIYDQYIDYLVNPNSVSYSIQFGTKGHSGAFSILHFWSEFTMKDILFFQIYISEKLKSFQYVVQLSEEKLHISQEKSYIIYQKPSYKLPMIDGKADQKFGNIHLEIRISDDRLVFFKMIVHKYHDYKYSLGLPFEELMELLFKVR